MRPLSLHRIVFLMCYRLLNFQLFHLVNWNWNFQFEMVQHSMPNDAIYRSNIAFWCLTRLPNKCTTLRETTRANNSLCWQYQKFQQPHERTIFDYNYKKLLLKSGSQKNKILEKICNQTILQGMNVHFKVWWLQNIEFGEFLKSEILVDQSKRTFDFKIWSPTRPHERTIPCAGNITSSNNHVPNAKWSLIIY